jgi:hypothetical protein
MFTVQRLVGLAVVALLAVAGVLFYLGSRGAEPAPLDIACGPVAGPSGGPYLAIAGVPCTKTAIVTGDVQGYVAPGGATDGSLIGDARNGARIRVVILGDAVITGGVPWVRVYVPTYESGGGDRDIFTWLPVSVDGTLQVVEIAETACPPTRDNLSTLGVLDPITRARCLGGGSITVSGAAGGQRGPVGYDVDPTWLSGWRERPGFSIRNEPFGEPIDVQLPDGVEAPPIDFVIELTAHAADPAARSCTRSVNDFEVLVEAPADSVLWCVARMVAERWTATLGPERRPIDPADPQLHRFKGGGACAGVGSGPLRFRMDPNALEPVWLEGEGGFRKIPWFTAQFEPRFQPELVIVDGAGKVVASDGQVVNPDGLLLGHSMCPTLQGLYFE